MARVLDEATIANLNSIIHANNAIVRFYKSFVQIYQVLCYFASNCGILLQVVSLLKDDSTFIQELFARLRSPSTSEESKKNLVFFFT